MSRLAMRALVLVPALALGACATLSGGGPSAATMRNTPAVTIVEVTPEIAATARAERLLARQAELNRALAALRGHPVQPEFRFGAGDVIEVTMWSFSPWPGGGAALGSKPAPMQLGSFTVAPDGTVMLPYAGPRDAGQLDGGRGADGDRRRYAALRILQRPTAMVRVATAPHSDVLVTGAVGQPRQIAWTSAGLTLAQAVTQALGDGNATLGAGDLSSTRAAVRVSISRTGMAPVELPIAAALEEQIPLHPGDRVVVRKAPLLEVTMLGAGTRRNGVIGFAKQPVLAEAIAEANGLDANTANDHAVFVLRRGEGAKPVLYDFAWKRAEGLVAAQQFPLENGDVVYVAEAPIVSVQKVVGLLFQLTLPAQVLR